MRSDLAVTRRVLLAEASATLAAAGVPEPRREALRIWSDLRDGSTADVIVDGDLESEPTLASALRAAVRRRAAGEPLAHVTGWTGFRSLRLKSDRRALIPRPETEGLVDLLLARARRGRVADIGTGSGCLALSLAAEGDFDSVVGVDSSSAALEQARENRVQSRGRVGLIRGDLCGPFAPASLDAIVSNPPYLTDGEYAILDPSVKQWEPAAALASGPDGLGATNRLLVEARDVLRPGGWLAIEVDSSRATTVAAQANAFGWMDVVVYADLFGRERHLLARRSAES